MFIPNGRRIYSNHLSCILSSGPPKIQLKISQKLVWLIPCFQQPPIMNRDIRKYTYYATDFIVKDTLGKKLHQNR